MSIEPIVAIAFDLGGKIYPRTTEVEFIRDRNEVSGKRFVIKSWATVARLERVTAGWPAYVDIADRYITLDRPGYHMTEVEYDQALARIEELMDIEFPDEGSLEPELVELLELAKRVEAYEHEHYPIAPPDNPNQTWE